MKEGWEYKKLGEVIEHLRTGLNPRTHFKLNTPDAEGYYVTVRELKGFAIEPDEKTDKVNKSAIKRINERSNLKIGDVLFSGTGTIGKTALVTELPENWNIKEGVYAMTPKHSELDSKYFIYYIGSDLFLRLVNDKAAGTGVRSIPMKELVKLPISVPPLSEQQSIVDYLDSAFAKIDAMKANAEKALNEAKALFQASLKEMLEPKEGWEEKTLGDICEIKSILVDPTEVQYKNLLHVGGANIVSETGELIDLKTAAQEGLTSGKFTFNDKDVLYNKIRPYLIKVSRPDFSGLCSADMYPLTSKKRMTRDYLYYILISRDFTDYAIMNSARAGMPKLNRQSLFAYKCMIPSLSEQQSIVATLDSLKSKVDRLQANYEKNSQECDALKQAILRQVFE